MGRLQLVIVWHLEMHTVMRELSLEQEILVYKYSSECSINRGQYQSLTVISQNNSYQSKLVGVNTNPLQLSVNQSFFAVNLYSKL